MRRLLVAALLLLAGAARADEIRLVDGEILYGKVVEEDARGLAVETIQGKRRLKAAQVAERVPAEPPRDELARREAALAPDDADGRVALAAFAWSRRLDDDEKRLLEAALAIDPDQEQAHLRLGHVRTAEGWAAGRPAPWPPAGRTGKRWHGARRDPAAVDALRWLAAHQDDDGRLDADGFSKHCPEGDVCDGPGGGHHGERTTCAFDPTVTALAVMAWAAGGSTPVSGPFADNLARGLAFCRRALAGGGGFDAIWNRAFCVQALADVCAAARDPALLPDLERGVAALLAQQLPDGGWSYVYSIGDVPTTTCVLMALGVAAQAGVGIEGERMERALDFLEARVDPRTARSEYHDGAEQKGYTPTTANAAGTLAARAGLGVLGATPDLARRIAAATGRKPKWKISFEEVKTRDGRTVRAQVGNLYPWAWYLASCALQRRSASSAWLKGLAAALKDGQVREGHAKGSWDPLGSYSLSGGRAFTTALGALMLLERQRYPQER